MIGQEYNQSADVYSFAIILWQILTGDILFPELQYSTLPLPGSSFTLTRTVSLKKTKDL